MGASHIVIVSEFVKQNIDSEFDSLCVLPSSSLAPNQSNLSKY